LVGCLAWSPSASAGTPSSDEDLRAALPYQAERSAPVTHEIDFSVIVTPPHDCKVLKVWLPIPQSDFGQEVSRSTWSTFPLEVAPRIGAEPTFGNRFAYFEFHQPKGAQIIRHRLSAKVWTLRWNVEPERVAAAGEWPHDFAPYLRQSRIAEQSALDRALAEIAAQRGESRGGLFGAMRWIDDNLTYDHVQASLQADPNHALRHRRGHCSDYHGLCATLGRTLGYPTRVTYGLSLYPKNSPSHCKLEAFLPPYGWVSFDLSETQKLVRRIEGDASLSAEERRRLSRAARTRTEHGFRENSWLLFTQGTDYDLAPPASQKVRVVRTAYVEVDGQPLPEPDPASDKASSFSWMTAHRYRADREFELPYKAIETPERTAE
jgi:transglutaminase-like putative cysteine protease